MEDNTVKSIAAMACLTVMVLAGLITGHNGVVLGTGLSLTAALAGYYAKNQSKS